MFQNTIMDNILEMLFHPFSLIATLYSCCVSARAIQEASELRVWVALTGSYLLNVADSQQVARSAREAIQKLKNAGMKSRNYVGVGHGIGGNYCQEVHRSCVDTFTDIIHTTRYTSMVKNNTYHLRLARCFVYVLKFFIQEDLYF